MSSRLGGRRWKRLPHSGVYRFRDGDVVCSDALECLRLLRDEIADVVFLDPPFNLGKQYAGRAPALDKKNETEYYSYLGSVIRRCCEILKPGGALYLYHIPRWGIRFAPMLAKHLEFRHWIAIAMKNGFVRGRRLYPAHYALLYFTKGMPSVFHRPKIPPPVCRSCGEYIRDYGGYKRFVEQGINLSDIWDDVSPVRHSNRKNRASNELPPVIPQRALAISGKRGGLLIDPFAGAGTTLLAAREAGMRFVAVDCEARFCALMKRRLSKRP